MDKLPPLFIWMISAHWLYTDREMIEISWVIGGWRQEGLNRNPADWLSSPDPWWMLTGARAPPPTWILDADFPLPIHDGF